MVRASTAAWLGAVIWIGAAALVAAAAEAPTTAPAKEAGAGATAAGAKGPLSDANFFPLAVWMQDPRNAPKYQAIGINLFVAADSDERTLSALKKLGLYAVCVAGEDAYKHKDDPTIVAWMHGDEPDNAQDTLDANGSNASRAYWKSIEDIRKAWPESTKKSLAEWGEYGPPIPPSQIVADYKKIKQADPTRPVLLNLGQGVAWEAYNGRGYRSGKVEDYSEYVKGCDIACFDIYPVNHDKKAVEGKLEFVAQGVDRLVKWAGGRPVWNCIECTPMGGPQRKPTPGQVRSEVWMSLIHGSGGIIYFVHIFQPKFIEPGVLEDKEMTLGIGALNKQIASLAAVLNSPTLADAAAVASSDKDVPIDLMVKKAGPAVYVFAIAMRGAPAKGAFQVKGLPERAAAEVLGEDRTIDVAGGKFADDFKGYEPHVYKITAAK